MRNEREMKEGEIGECFIEEEKNEDGMKWEGEGKELLEQGERQNEGHTDRYWDKRREW